MYLGNVPVGFDGPIRNRRDAVQPRSVAPSSPDLLRDHREEGIQIMFVRQCDFSGDETGHSQGRQPVPFVQIGLPSIHRVMVPAVVLDDDVVIRQRHVNHVPGTPLRVVHDVVHGHAWKAVLFSGQSEQRLLRGVGALYAVGERFAAQPYTGESAERADVFGELGVAHYPHRLVAAGQPIHSHHKAWQICVLGHLAYRIGGGDTPYPLVRERGCHWPVPKVDLYVAQSSELVRRIDAGVQASVVEPRAEVQRRGHAMQA